MMKPFSAIATAAAIFVLAGCATEPRNGCMLAAINERAVLRAKNYMQPNVESHLLAIWFQHSQHVALVVKGDHRWFAWDDAYGGRPLFLDESARLPNALVAAQAAFPRKSVELAWWVDEPGRPPAAEKEPTSVTPATSAANEPTVAARRGRHRTVAGRQSVARHPEAVERRHRGAVAHRRRSAERKPDRTHRRNRNGNSR